MNQEQIQKQAKKIMDEFKAALDKVDTASLTAEERGETMRTPGVPEKSEEFKDKMLKNAKKKNEEYIIAERKHW